MLEMIEVEKEYRNGERRVSALRGVNLCVKDGEFLAITGASGSGKTTMMNILGCIDSPTSGEYLINGESVLKRSDRELSRIRNREIGFVFQTFNLMPSMDILRNVELPMLYCGVKARERRERAVAALERVGLGERLTHLPSRLSGGQRQRAAVARAIVNRPTVLLADEPTGNLDSVTAGEIMALFTELNRGGISLVMVTHEKRIAAAADRQVTVCDGRLAAG